MIGRSPAKDLDQIPITWPKNDPNPSNTDELELNLRYMSTKNAVSSASTTHRINKRSLSALLSQVLVAFTVEFDNEFERQMGEAGYPGARLSLVLWSNLIRFLGDGALSVCDLAARALAPEKGIKFELGCLERWGFVALQPAPTDDRPVPTRLHRQSGRELRDGWGSGRGIRNDWMVRLTSKGLTTSEIWPPLFDEIERRWEARFGKDDISHLRQTLQDVVGQLDVELPHGLPGDWEGTKKFPPRVRDRGGFLPLPTLLSQLLQTFRLEFDRESPAPLVLCANTLRVLGETPIRESEIPRLTGGSPETSGLGWQIRSYILVKPDPVGRRGKVVILSPRGLRAKQAYHRLIEEIEQRWKARFGGSEIGGLHESLQGLFDRRTGHRPLLSEGLLPPPGTARAGDQTPALGRRDVGPAARQRMRDLMAQTEAFVRDPAGALPHYPLWDMNRGFGP